MSAPRAGRTTRRDGSQNPHSSNRVSRSTTSNTTNRAIRGGLRAKNSTRPSSQQYKPPQTQRASNLQITSTRSRGATPTATPKRPPTSNQSWRRTENAGNSDYKQRIEEFFQQLRSDREKERANAVRNGLLADPNKRTRLEDAITVVGTCQTMCPEFERIQRIREQAVERPEKSTLPSGAKVPDEELMVKCFHRSDAGKDEQLPSDLRPPPALQKTLNYLFDEILGGSESLASVHKFLWDRTRAIRNDFSIQQVSKTEDLKIAIDCFERIARFHLLSLHQLTHSRRDNGDFVPQQEREQLSNTLVSLMYYYDDSRSKLQSPNEAEFRAYSIILEIRSRPQDLKARVQNLPRSVMTDIRVQTAMRMHAVAGKIRNVQNLLSPLTRTSSMSKGDYVEFWSIVRSKSTTYLMACATEVAFNFVRARALETMEKTFRAGKGNLVPKLQEFSMDDLVQVLGFDEEEQARNFLEAIGFSFKQRTDGELFLDLDGLGRIPIDGISRQEQMFSERFVEFKRKHRAYKAVANGLSVKQCVDQGLINQDSAEESDESLFVSSASNSPQRDASPAPSQVAKEVKPLTSSNTFLGQASAPTDLFQAKKDKASRGIFGAPSRNSVFGSTSTSTNPLPFTNPPSLSNGFSAFQKPPMSNQDIANSMFGGQTAKSENTTSPVANETQTKPESTSMFPTAPKTSLFGSPQSNQASSIFAQGQRKGITSDDEAKPKAAPGPSNSVNNSTPGNQTNKSLFDRTETSASTTALPSTVASSKEARKSSFSWPGGPPDGQNPESTSTTTSNTRFSAESLFAPKCSNKSPFSTFNSNSSAISSSPVPSSQTPFKSFKSPFAEDSSPSPTSLFSKTKLDFDAPALLIQNQPVAPNTGDPSQSIKAVEFQTSNLSTPFQQPAKSQSSSNPTLGFEAAKTSNITSVFDNKPKEEDGTSLGSFSQVAPSQFTRPAQTSNNNAVSSFPSAPNSTNQTTSFPIPPGIAPFQTSGYRTSVKSSSPSMLTRSTPSVSSNPFNQVHSTPPTSATQAALEKGRLIEEQQRSEKLVKARSEALDKLTQELVIGEYGLIEQMTEHLMEGIYKDCVKEIRHERKQAKQVELRKQYLRKKYSSLWREKAYKLRLRRQAVRRRKHLAQSARELTRNAREPQRLSVASSQSPDMPGQANGAIPLGSLLTAPHHYHVNGDTGTSNANKRKSTSIDEREGAKLVQGSNTDMTPWVFKKPRTSLHRRSQTVGVSLPSFPTSKAMVAPSQNLRASLGASRRSLFGTSSIMSEGVVKRARHLLGKTDTTQTDYFRLKAMGIDPNTPAIPETRKRSRASTESLHEPPSVEPQNKARKLSPPSLSSLSPQTRSLLSRSQSASSNPPPNSAANASTPSNPTPTKLTSEEEELFAQARRLREALAEDEAWFRRERKTMEAKQKAKKPPPEGETEKQRQLREWQSTPSKTSLRLQQTNASGLLSPDWIDNQKERMAKGKDKEREVDGLDSVNGIVNRDLIIEESPSTMRIKGGNTGATQKRQLKGFAALANGMSNGLGRKSGGGAGSGASAEDAIEL